MFNAYRVIVRRAVEGGIGPDAIVKWVRAETCQLTTRYPQNRLPKDRLVELLSDRLAMIVAAERAGALDTRLEQSVQAFRPKV